MDRFPDQNSKGNKENVQVTKRNLLMGGAAALFMGAAGSASALEGFLTTEKMFPWIKFPKEPLNGEDPGVTDGSLAVLGITTTDDVKDQTHTMTFIDGKEIILSRSTVLPPSDRVQEAEFRRIGSSVRPGRFLELIVRRGNNRIEVYEISVGRFRPGQGLEAKFITVPAPLPRN